MTDAYDACFDIGGGAVIGAQHRRTGRSGQDACSWRHVAGGILAVVCDGCGSGKHSDVGAKIGAEIVLECLAAELESCSEPRSEALWSRVSAATLQRLEAIASAMGRDRRATVVDYFLFTIVGVVVGPELTTIFSVGDGVVAVNGRVRELGPFADNAPPYLGYGLLDGHVAPKVCVESVGPTDSIHTLLIGTDGVVDLLGDDDELASFWTDDRKFTNRDGVRRALEMRARQNIDIDWAEQRIVRQRGRLADDTALVVVRRRRFEDR